MKKLKPYQNISNTRLLVLYGIAYKMLPIRAGDMIVANTNEYVIHVLSTNEKIDLDISHDCLTQQIYGTLSSKGRDNSPKEYTIALQGFGPIWSIFRNEEKKDKHEKSISNLIISDSSRLHYESSGSQYDSGTSKGKS